MMWDQVMERVVASILADSMLAGIYASHVRMAGTGEQQVPGIEWTLIGDTEGELWAPMIVQFDLWHSNAETLRASERRLRGMFHVNVMLQLDDLKLFSSYNDGAMLATPDRSGYHGRAIRFTMIPLRSQYARVPSV